MTTRPVHAWAITCGAPSCEETTVAAGRYDDAPGPQLAALGWYRAEYELPLDFVINGVYMDFCPKHAARGDEILYAEFIEKFEKES